MMSTEKINLKEEVTDASTFGSKTVAVHQRNQSLGDTAGFQTRESINTFRNGVPKIPLSPSSMIDQFLEEMGGEKAIYSVLVANNGLAAVKFMRSIRSWATQTFGHSKAITLVAMATPNDININAEHIQLADQFVDVPGGSNNNNYANVSLIVQVAERCHVDAVWPGWGHASENPELPAALAERNITFLGPGSAAMAALGDKIGSTILAQAAGVPTLSWSGNGVSISYSECGGVIPEEIYQQACIHNVEEALKSCQAIGYPVMLKASWGGGGKGIRKVHNDDEVRQVFKQVQGEVPGSPIFAMKLAPISRHLEVQLLADAHGNVASLMSRDCSVQRRHQKIVEEGPVTVASQEDLRNMEKCARALARSVGYVGVATVEFLYLVEERRYCFLELNPRLQVEHPVTEGITGINIPACQLMVGMGIPLWRIPYIRALYCQDPRSALQFDLEQAPQKPADCHVVAVRITAEDANDGFKPTCGHIDEVHFRPTPEVWGYFSVKSGGGIHEYSDSQFGHLFARGDTREAALRNMVVALRDVAIRGEIRTTVDYVLEMVQSPDLVNNNIHTGWLDLRIARKVQSKGPPWHLSVIAGAVVKAYQHISTESAEYLLYLSKGHLPPPGISLTVFTDNLIISGCKYPVEVVRSSPTSFTVSLNGSSVDVRTRKMVDGGFLMQVDGGSHIVHAEEETLGTRLIINTLTCLLSKEADPSRLVASSPGKLIRYLLPSGSHVEGNQAYAEIEVMKMVMPLLAPMAGVLTCVMPEGSAMAGGDLIARLELDDASSVVRAEPYLGAFPAEVRPPVVPSNQLDQKFKSAFEDCKNVMAGYIHSVPELMSRLLSCLDNPALALFQWHQELSVVRNRLPTALVSALDAAVASHADDVQVMADLASQGLGLSLLQVQMESKFPAAELLQAMKEADENAPASDRPALHAMLDPLSKLVTLHLGGKEAYARKVAEELLEDLLRVEEAFRPDPYTGAMTDQEIIDSLRKVHSGNLQAVLDMVVSHQGISTKSELAQRLLTALVVPDPASYRPLLRRLTALRTKGAEQLVLRANNLLEQSLLSDLRAVVARALSGLDMFSGSNMSAVTSLYSGLLSPGSGLERDTTFHSPSTPHAAHSNLSSLTRPLAPESSLDISSGSILPQSADSFPVEEGMVVRRSTEIEGLYRGLPSRLIALKGAVSRSSTSQIESKMEMLVSVPAAVEDALVSLMLDPADEDMQSRAAITYIRRIYHPHMLRIPTFNRKGVPLHPTRIASSPGTVSASSPGNHTLVGVVGDGCLATSVWLFEDPQPDGITGTFRTCAGALLLLDNLEALNVGLEHLEKELSELGIDKVPVLLHIAVAGDDFSRVLQQSGSHSSSLEDQTGLSLVSQSELGNDNMLPEALPKATEQALSSAAANVSVSLQKLNVGSVSLVCRKYDSDLPLRACLAWDGNTGKYVTNRFGRQLEPFTCCLLELPKLKQYKALQYSPSRNRQWRMYTAVERPDPKSYSLRRLFVRGTVRQLGHPALLAACYSGSSSGVAAAAVNELEEGLVGCLMELSKLQNSPMPEDASTPGGGAEALSGRPDWTHLFVTVLPPLPTFHTASSFLGSESFSYAHLTEDSTSDDGAESKSGAPSSASAMDHEVGAALKAATAALTAKHIALFRGAAVAQLEVRLKSSSKGKAAWRVVVSLPTGHEHGEEHIEVFKEVADADSSHKQPEQTNIHGLTGPIFPMDIDSPCNYMYQHLSSETLPKTSSSVALDEAAAQTSSGSVAQQQCTASSSLHGRPVLGPYPPLLPLQQRRLAARRHTVTYCYDFPSVFEDALRDAWTVRGMAGEPGWVPPSGRLVEAEELVLPSTHTGSYKKDGRLQRTSRHVGGNDCGMVVWLMTLKTPESPQGRKVVAVANDITYQSGAFGPREDAVFRAATALALQQRIPLLYLAANSGARVGLANEVRERLKIEWVDANNPEKGFHYLYLDDEDYSALKVMATSKGVDIIRAEPREVTILHTVNNGDAEHVVDDTSSLPKTVRWVLSDIIGLEDGLGVECLSGSGAIASAYCKAFREGYTITLVSGRTVGIGAYLARLGRRCVQRADQPIILTGYSALNKLLGRQVYSSQMQLGGPRVMGQNGVSHHVVRDDLEGVKTIIKLLSYALLEASSPSVRGGLSAPALSSSLLHLADPVDRLVSYGPGPGEKLDPRAAIAGLPYFQPDCSSSALMPSTTHQGWRGGLFDRGSWLESHPEWARTVVTGRARLGGVPVGVIAVETQVVKRHMPADPGMPDSSEQVIPQAGQVWYPDSAQKTALAIEEFSLEGLPLMILANWRGFSGGQRDLFDGVLQAGSLIVEQLRQYKNPVFVYIPCGAELRGGAWVVIDSQINAACVEMYADPTARGGVLEPEGVVEIKFRKPDLLRLMHRLDPKLQQLKLEPFSDSSAAAVRSREKTLLPVYQQVARQFADMHDTPVRMLAKGVIRSIVPWGQARSFFAIRLRRRLMEETLASHIQNTDNALSRTDALSVVGSWYALAQSGSVALQAQLGPSSPSSYSGPSGATPSLFSNNSHADSRPALNGRNVEVATTNFSSPDSLYERQKIDDSAFLDWAESGSGKAQIAGELRVLRTRCAARTVSQVLGSSEGREGLMASVQAAVKKDAVLMMQLKMMLNDVGSEKR